MKRIEWRDEFSIGVGLFDQQHKQILALVNSLIAPQEGISDSQHLVNIITELLKLTYDHFAYEERLMKQFDYPDFEDHKLQHTDFVNKTKALSEAAELQVPSVPEWLMIHIQDWFSHHIIDVDMKYKAFFQDSDLE